MITPICPLHVARFRPLLDLRRCTMTMWFARLCLSVLLAWCLTASVSATIMENGQPRLDPYPGQVDTIDLDSSWRSYDADAPEIAYKGRWDSKHISCTIRSH